MALLLLGPGQRVVIAVAGAWMQCTFKVKQPLSALPHRFSMAAEAITMVATGSCTCGSADRSGSVDLSSTRQPARRGDRHVLRRQYRPCRRRDCAVIRPHVVAGVARRIPLERAELHGGWQRRSARGGRHRARRALGGRADAGARLSDLPDLSSLRRPSRRSGGTLEETRRAARRRRSTRCAGAQAEQALAQEKNGWPPRWPT